MKKRKIKGLSLAVAILVGSFVGTSQAQFISPAGTWDLIVSGAEKGVAYITFDDEGGLTGYEILTPTKQGEPDDSDTRSSGSAGRVVTETPNGTVERLVGFWLLSGTWAYDVKGNVVGVYTEGNDNRTDCTTNQQVVTTTFTNDDGGVEVIIETNLVLVCVTNPITNGVSFTAKVRPDRITIKTTSPIGVTTLKGVPAEDAPDISGSYYVKAKKAGVPYNELITLTPVAFNAYEVVGVGPNYEINGVALVSNQRKLSIQTSGSETNPLMSAFGGINFNRGKASLNSHDENSKRGTYNMFKQPEP